MPCVEVISPVLVPMDSGNLLPQLQIGACCVDQLLCQQFVAAFDVEQPAVYGGQQ